MNDKPRWSKRGIAIQCAMALISWAFILPALGDGKVFPAIAFPAEVKIPDQSALLIWSNGVERLVIETRFVGEGTNFAWVVPLPSVPVIEPATTGLFPTLRHWLSPELVHSIYSYWALTIFVCGLLWLITIVRRDQPARVSHLLVCFLTAGGFAVSSHSPAVAITMGPLLFLLLLLATNRVRRGNESLLGFLLAVLIVSLLAGMLLPALGTAKSASISGGPGVEVLDRKLVGIFETTTIASKEPDALIRWLTDNGFAVSTNARPVIDQHVRDGWVFVATKVHRDAGDTTPATPHPLSFTFKSAKPVYPLRLTGVGNDGLAVELFVVGAEHANIAGFKVTECRAIDRTRPDSGWWLRSSGKIGHPQFLDWSAGAVVMTRLEATLGAADMRQDAAVGWENFRNTKSRLYSDWGAAQMAANATVPLAAIVILLASILANRGRLTRNRAWRFSGGVLAAAGLVALIIYVALPKVPVRMQRMPWALARNNLQALASGCASSHPTNQPVTLDSVRNELARYLSKPNPRRAENFLLGGPIREEDSPGNYTLRETPEGVEIIGHDATGAERSLALVTKTTAR